MASYSSESSESAGDSPRRTSSNPRTYMCKVCGNEFTSGQSLGGHMNVHRKDQRSPSHAASAAESSFGRDCTTPAFKGVRYRNEQKKWVAEIRPPKADRTWWLGTYSSPEEAAYAYDVAIKYFGSETSLNFDRNPIYDQIPRIDPDLPNQDFAAQLRKVVKKYGKLAMQADPGDAGPSSSHPQAPAELQWPDFENLPGPNYENDTPSYSGPFDFELNDYNDGANSYNNYGPPYWPY